MNLIQIQERLKDFNNEKLIAAANKQFPDIPPLLAEMEMKRRERIKAQSNMPPTESVKDKLEQKLSEPQGIQQAMPQQGEQLQGQPQGQPQQMAGVAGLPTGNMFKALKAGGIIAFAEGDEVPEAKKASAALQYAPFIKEAGSSIKTMQDEAKVTTPQEELEKINELHRLAGIKAPKEEEIARIEQAKKDYEKDVDARESLQARKMLAAAARPNVHGKYMFGTIGEEGATYGLANLEADRKFREENQKAMVAAKEAQREFALGNVNKAVEFSKKSEEYRQKANSTAATAYGQMGAQGLSSLTQQMATQENARYHDMWEKMEDKKLKADYAKTAASLQMNAPELLKVVEGLKKSEFAKKMTDDQLLTYAADLIAQTRGAESREDTAYNQAVQRRSEKVAEQMAIDPGVLNAKAELQKAQKSGSQVDIDAAMRKLRQARSVVEEQFPAPAKPSRPGVPGGASTANPSAKPNTTQYDAKGNPVVTPSPVPAP